MFSLVTGRCRAPLRPLAHGHDIHFQVRTAASVASDRLFSPILPLQFSSEDAEPLLSAIGASSSHYAHACELLQLLFLFIPMLPAKVPHTSCDDAAASAAAAAATSVDDDGGGGGGDVDGGDDVSLLDSHWIHQRIRH